MQMHVVKPAEFCGIVEEFADIYKINVKGKEVPAVMPEQVAKQILANRVFKSQLPEIKNISACPVLVEKNGTLETVTGYNPKVEVYADGCPPENMNADEGVKIIREEVFKDYLFASPEDESRAAAMYLAPALLMGQVLTARPPVFVIEADIEGTGKGTLARGVSAVYSAKWSNIVQRKNGGVGSDDEALMAALDRGTGFILFDNRRGKFNSPYFESAATEPLIEIRLPYRGNISCDPTRTVFAFTSNGVEFNKDMARRLLVIRLNKQPQEYQFEKYTENSIEGYISANQQRFLGAVFAILKDWYKAGKPSTDETRHSFRPWVQPLDWIVQNLMGLPGLMGGHSETVERMSNPALQWVRDAALILTRNMVFEWLPASGIADELNGEMEELPGLSSGDGLTDDNHIQVAKNIGRLMKKAFRDRDEITIDSFLIQRKTTYSEMRNEIKLYSFTHK
ncbi:MAG: hypothetical protein U9R20_05310 [Thermodesulfobacteriota bacterium]|nr:hypothetical protein [Thermodesulfobacteriota bacterium]